MPFKILVDSSKRTSQSASSSDFYIDFPTNVPECEIAVLHWVVLPLATYTISTGSNTIYFNENSTNKNAVITPGYYSGPSLASAIQTSLNTASSGYNTYTVSYSSQTYGMTFSASNPFSLLWATGSPYLACGFQAVNTLPGTSISSTQACNLVSPLTCNISIRELDTTVITGGNQVASTFMVPLEAGTSYLNSFQPQGGFKTHITPRSFNKFHIRLMDFDNNVLNLNGADWSFALTLYSRDELMTKRPAESLLDERPFKILA